MKVNFQNMTEVHFCFEDEFKLYGKGSYEKICYVPDIGGVGTDAGVGSRKTNITIECSRGSDAAA
ncbi:hypothetical protein PRLR6025_06730 [Prevotella lacticifex]|nr:hypothetical protein PRLR6014_02000 [Prevotella lacticifex]GJG67204.1 hypothetical protein PRLR6025_06730 [Prevotella lacticifex]